MYSDDANKIVEQATQERNALKNFNFIINLVMVTNDTKPAPGELQTFNETWNHPNNDSHKKWQEVIHKEFTDMSKQQVWCMTCKSLVPPNHRCIKNKWIFKINHKCVYKECLVACRYAARQYYKKAIKILKNSGFVGGNVNPCLRV